MKPKQLVIPTLLFLLLVGNFLVWTKVIFASSGKLIVKVYDIGQGDSIFIKTPGNYKILIDGGPTNKVLDYLNQDLGLNDRSLDLLVLTHPQNDHMFGLIEVVKQFRVKNVLVSGVANTTASFKLWQNTLDNAHLQPKIAHQGQTINLADQVRLQILWPKETKPQVSDLNQAAVVMKVSYGNFDMLLTADADQVVQPYTSMTTHVEVLKVPHHGSKTALREDFLRSLNPDVSVISVGAKNNYGHPNQFLLGLLQKYSKKIFRTDQNGTVEFVSDGVKWYTQLEKEN